MKYIRNNNFQLKDIAGDHILIARGPIAIDFGAVVLFNETGVFLWNQLASARDLPALAELLAAEYEIPAETALEDVKAFLDRMLKEGMIEQREED